MFLLSLLIRGQTASGSPDENVGRPDARAEQRSGSTKAAVLRRGDGSFNSVAVVLSPLSAMSRRRGTVKGLASAKGRGCIRDAAIPHAQCRSEASSNGL